jgi:DNA-binding FrmR family transcriptional regulator
MASYGKDKEAILARLKKMEGQIKGVRRMIEEDRYCVDVLDQLSSIIAASHKVAGIIMADHIKGCVRHAITDQERSEDMLNELVGVVDRFTRR